jgi:protoporphyrinogen oxidase
MKTIVVGAGIAGLAAGYELQKRGHQVQLYEAHPVAGGRGQLLKRPDNDDCADVGTQYFHSNYRLGMALIKELGLQSELKNIKGNTRFFTAKGPSFLVTPTRPYMPPGGLWGNLRMAWYVLSLVVKHRLQVYGLEPQQKLDQTPALQSTSSDFVKDYIARMLVLIGGLNEPAESNVSLLQVLRLIRIILMTDYVSLNGGTASLHAELASRLNVTYNSPVDRLLLDGERVVGVQLVNGEKRYADHVVVACHAPAAARLLPQDWEPEKQFLSGIQMPPAVIVSLFLNTSLEQGTWSYMLPIENQGLVTFLTDTQQKNPKQHPSGKATLQAWVLNPQAVELLNQDDDTIVHKVLSDIAPYFPNLKTQLEGSAVTRHQHAVPQSPVGHNQQALAFLAAADKRQGVSFCGDYLSGGYLECALWSVQRMLATLG